MHELWLQCRRSDWLPDYRFSQRTHDCDAYCQLCALQRAFSIDGPVLVDVVVAKEELAIPPQIMLEQAKGFSLYMLRAIISGRGDEVIELAKTNWLR